MKTCSLCKIEKLFEEFGKNKTKKYGLNSYCRDCRKQYDSKRQLSENDKEIKAYKNKFYSNNYKDLCTCGNQKYQYAETCQICYIKIKVQNNQGNKTKANGGYVKVLISNHPHGDKRGRVLEHRLVMEKI